MAEPGDPAHGPDAPGPSERSSGEPITDNSNGAPRRMTLVGIASRIPTMETLPITEVKTRLTEMVVQVEKQRDRILITRNGKPAALLVSVGEWESINETLDVLSDPEALKDIREANEAYARGEIFGNEDIAEILRARRDDVGHVA